MPFYEYQCEACGHHHEAMQKMSDAPLRKCPECGKSRLKRLISAPVFRLKGGGWYETDFKSDKEGKRNLHGDEPAADKSGITDKKTEATPAKAESTAEPKSEPKVEAKAEKPEPKAASRSAAKAPARKAPSRTRKPAPKPARRR
jgi:putative FmdB family regulatory protein